MKIDSDPLILQYDTHRQWLRRCVRWCTAPLRAVAWLLGALVGAVLCGFSQGWEDIR